MHPSFLAGDRRIVLGSGAGDNAGAALGLGAEEGDVVVSLGTSGTVFAVAPQAVADRSGTVAGFADASGLFLPLVATLNAARVLSSVAGILGVDHDGFADLAREATPGSDGVVLVPYFEGERTHPTCRRRRPASTISASPPRRAPTSPVPRSRACCADWPTPSTRCGLPVSRRATCC
ncbi:hypothetical protein MN0502_28440 [Arthrobacter sp. MN05-02]|nr:hypothetical protein MN0502_28440 [Arthrobacter sp. MN05-02]